MPWPLFRKDVRTVRKNQHPSVPADKGVGMFQVRADLPCRIGIRSGAEENDEFVPRKGSRINQRSLLAP